MIIVKFILAAIVAGTPLLFGTLGEIMNERVGHLNLGVEGMMSIGATAGFMAAYMTDSFIAAVIAAFAAGALSGLIYALLTVTFMANQNVTGLTLTIFGIGLANFIGYYCVAKAPEGTLKLPEHVMNVMAMNPFVYLGIAAAVALHFYYYHTNVGLSVRAIGENPASADAAGVNVTRLKFINIVIGGGICGIGGAYTLMITNGGVWINDCVGGLGWIAVALVIFASWKPVNAIAGSFIFGAFRILKFYVNKSVIPVPDAFFDMLPFVVTALVLVISSMRKRKDNVQPAACGFNYFREER